MIHSVNFIPAAVYGAYGSLWKRQLVYSNSWDRSVESNWVEFKAHDIPRKLQLVFDVELFNEGDLLTIDMVYNGVDQYSIHGADAYKLITASGRYTYDDVYLDIGETIIGFVGRAYVKISLLDPMFNAVNTYDDWHIMQDGRPTFTPPEPKTIYEDNPGGNGNIDLTEALAGEPLYNSRTGQFTFYVLNSLDGINENRRHWAMRYSSIMNYLQGREMMAILEDDPSYYYKGRFAVNQWQSVPSRSKLVINYTVDPYKYDLTDSADDWLWDPFNFETGVIRRTADIPVTSADGWLKVPFHDVMMRTTPTFEVTVAEGDTITLDIVRNGIDQYDIYGSDILKDITQSGTYKFYDYYFERGEDVIGLYGNGTVTIHYQGGSL